MSAGVKKETHEVAKGYLKRWKNTDGKLWVFDIESQSIQERSLEATFAVEDFLYVPLVDGIRDDSTEDWFCKAENELARFIKKLSKRDFHTPLHHEKLFLTVLGIVGLCHRSSYELRMIERAVESDQDLRTKLGINLDSSEARHIFAVENMINLITKQTELFCTGAISIAYDYKSDLLVCDRPGFDMTVRGHGVNVIPLGPKEMMYIELGSERPPSFVHGVSYFQVQNEQSIVDTVNHFTIERARKWVVARTRQQLEEIAPQLSKELVAKRQLTDRMVFTPLTEAERERGWRLRTDEEKDPKDPGGNED